MKLIEYFFYGIARCCLWILPGRAPENGGALCRTRVPLFPRTKNKPQVLLDNSQNMDYHNHKMNIMFMTIYSI